MLGGFSNKGEFEGGAHGNVGVGGKVDSILRSELKEKYRLEDISRYTD
jgi:hypothetical protein